MSSVFRQGGSLPLPRLSPHSVQWRIPAFLYGTAWKKERTTSLVLQALTSGFAGIDTAAQPKHYREDLVGEAVKQFLMGSSKGRRREDIYIQTKYTPISGQDQTAIMPYNPQLPLPDQIKVSMTSSLHSFQTHSADDAEADPSHLPYVDCLVLHSQLPTLAETLSAWQTMESLTPHYARHLGISNTSLTTLQYLCAAARIKPAVVQNRFYAPTRYDVPLRKFCVEKGIVYQAFWTLTANPGLLASKPVASLVETSGVSREVGLYCFVLGLENVVVLNGTTSVERMKGDLEGVEKVREWIESEAGGDQWEEWMREFKALIGEL